MTEYNDLPSTVARERTGDTSVLDPAAVEAMARAVAAAAGRLWPRPATREQGAGRTRRGTARQGSQPKPAALGRVG